LQAQITKNPIMTKAMTNVAGHPITFIGKGKGSRTDNRLELTAASSWVLTASVVQRTR